MRSEMTPLARNLFKVFDLHHRKGAGMAYWALHICLVALRLVRTRGA